MDIFTNYNELRPIKEFITGHICQKLCYYIIAKSHNYLLFVCSFFFNFGDFGMLCFSSCFSLCSCLLVFTHVYSCLLMFTQSRCIKCINPKHFNLLENCLLVNRHISKILRTLAFSRVHFCKVKLRNTL